MKQDVPVFGHFREEPLFPILSALLGFITHFRQLVVLCPGFHCLSGNSGDMLNNNGAVPLLPLHGHVGVWIQLQSKLIRLVVNRLLGQGSNLRTRVGLDCRSDGR